ncbi:PRELI domain-containing protein 1, mitochondrial-like [Salvelinus fontinalis]|uniref:PRELI domain-containing protein 1, mitochondrial-like n=1 Tax=Salvelinus fontinalis TaxID=8038 RepID=UPI00248631AC|nr:PRELI domain-containing protein 1, mitochondrial-like [Salvelinus fontinalis]
MESVASESTQHSYHRQDSPKKSVFRPTACTSAGGGRMVKYFSNDVDIRTTWDHVVSAFWQRYPNPFSTHVLTEDVVFREVTADQQLLSRRLLTKTNRMPRWAEFLFPSNLSRSVYIVEDSVVDPVTKSLTTYTWNLNHTTLMVRYTPTYAPFRIGPYTKKWLGSRG